MGSKYSDREVTVRRAKKEDMSAVAEMIQVSYWPAFLKVNIILCIFNIIFFQELADFEKMPDGPQLSLKGIF